MALEKTGSCACDVVVVVNRGDPRVGVNQNYDRMPYTIPLANLP